MNSTATVVDRNVQAGTAQVIPFRFESREVRTAVIDGEPWFAAKDIIRSLDYAKSSSPAKLIEHVPEQWKGVNPIHTPGGTQKLLMLSEHGLYFFLGRSDKLKALPFQMWVAGEVLPAIRKHGRYEDTSNRMGTLLGQTIGTDGFHCLAAVLDGKVRRLPAKLRAGAKNRIWSQVRKGFSVTSVEDIPADKLDSARNFIAAYVLQGEYLPRDDAPATDRLDIDFSIADWSKVCQHVKTATTGDRSTRVYVPIKAVIGDYSDSPSPLRALLGKLRKAGYNVDAYRLELDGLKHHLSSYNLMAERLVERIGDIRVHGLGIPVNSEGRLQA